MVTVEKVIDREHGHVRIELHGAERGQDFYFVMNKDTIDVHPVANGHPEAANWVTQLTDEEKLAVFNIALAHQRKRSTGDQGFKLASIGVTDTGRIYIRENSERLSTDHNRQCAEQNMVVTAENGESFHKEQQAIMRGEDESDIQPEKPHFQAVYLMGGREGDIPIACPCGNCTDLLAKHMDTDGEVWVLPAGDGTKPLVINHDVVMASELEPDEAWKTSIGHLKPHAKIKLNPTQKELQQHALNDLCRDLSAVLKPAVDYFAVYPELMNPLRNGTQDRLVLPYDTPELQKTIEDPQVLDHRVNKFMATEIKNTILNRIQGIIIRAVRQRQSIPDLSPEGIKALIRQHRIHADCSVIEMENGFRYSNVIGQSTEDNAQQPPEVNVVTISNKEHGTVGIRRHWGMHFGIDAVEAGTMPTSPSAGVERIIKRRPKFGDDTINFSYFPFNDNCLTVAQVASIRHDFTGQQLFPGYFSGKASQLKQQAPEPEAALAR